MALSRLLYDPYLGSDYDLMPLQVFTQPFVVPRQAPMQGGLSEVGLLFFRTQMNVAVAAR